MGYACVLISANGSGKSNFVLFLDMLGWMLRSRRLGEFVERCGVPTAVALIGDMIKSLAVEVQVIVATQSPLLVDVFDLEDIVVLEAKDGRTSFGRLATDDYRHWLDESFAPGELWQKNLIGGRP